MKTIQDQINELSDSDIVRLTFWIFEQEKKKSRDDFVSVKTEDLNSDKIKNFLNSKLNNWGVDSIINIPVEKKIVDTFRMVLSDYAEKEPQAINEMIKGLHLQAGGFGVAEILQGVDISYILLIIMLLLKPHFKISYDKKQGIAVSLEMNSSESVIKELLKKLPIFHGN